jgi:hypothetical protein
MKTAEKKNIEIPEYLREIVLSLDVRTVLGVPYLHLRTETGADMFFTEAGVPFVKHLLPSAFISDREWFTAHRTVLDGSTLPYRVATKSIDGISIDVVFKWNRMGVNPLLPDSHHQFNSPFEEFALVLELKSAARKTIGTQEPLAIYVPSDRATLESLLRRSYIMQGLVESHYEAELDMHREYAVIYRWVPGESLLEKITHGSLKRETGEQWTEQIRQEMADKGFAVVDHKMCHVILDSKDDAGPLEKDGGPRYHLVDFELLYRTPNHEKNRKKARRELYYEKQSKACFVHPDLTGHEELHHVNILGVDYICGEVSSTGGYLWVVGRDPGLFEYYLPEKWKTMKKEPVSVGNKTYRTRTDDDIDIIWRVSSVGERPIVEPSFTRIQEMPRNGYNSPFEEFSFAFDLESRGIRTTAPRAIYMSGQNTDIRDYLYDESRFLSHASLTTPDGRPVLSKNNEYTTIWENCLWAGEVHSGDDHGQLEAVDALQAYYQSRITEQEYSTLIRYESFRLAKLGYYDPNLRGYNMLLFLNDRNEVHTDEQGIPIVRYCNLEFMVKRVPEQYSSRNHTTFRYA